MADQLTPEQVIQNISNAHPVPWRTVVHPNGLVQVADANNMEVPLFAMTDMLTAVTTQMKEKQTA